MHHLLATCHYLKDPRSIQGPLRLLQLLLVISQNVQFDRLYDYTYTKDGYIRTFWSETRGRKHIPRKLCTLSTEYFSNYYSPIE
jgi:hypothetical protein